MKLIRSIVSALVIAALLLGVIWGAYTLFPLKYLDEIRLFSAQMELDPYLVTALIKAESNFGEGAVSRADAKGVMQLTDDTALFCAQKLN
ncbi:MAG: transglycosylase SLT domain-containing protein, partial [Clostridia bacterium]|nr:transglycosylase SLT domain-containing protein [Clostridia bacterium]